MLRPYTRMVVKSLRHIFILAIALVVLFAAGYETSDARQDESQAGLVVQFADGSVQTYCLSFTGETITGLDLLLKSGLPVLVKVYGGLGAEVCKIGDDGCNYPEQLCACESYGPGGKYWSYHHLKNGRWQSSVKGAGTYVVRNGEVEGWAWSDGSPPPLFTFEQICGVTQPPPATVAQPHAETATPLRPAETRPARLSATPTLRVLPTATRQKAQPTSTPLPLLPQFTPTGQARGPAPTTVVATATAITIPSATTTLTPEPSRTSIPTATLTPTVTPTSIRTASSESMARNVGIIIGAMAIGGLALWGLVGRLKVGRGRGRRVG